MTSIIRLRVNSASPLIRRPLLGAVGIAALLSLAGCRQQSGDSGDLSAAQKAAIASEIEAQVKAAYDLSTPGAPQRYESLYGDSGRVVSASGGRMIASRDTLLMGIREFWQYVGRNMQKPTWMWDAMAIDVLSPGAAVMTATYHVPHTTPAGRPHVIGGAWTAVFQKRGDRWVIVQEHLSDLPPTLADSAHAHMNHDTTTTAGR